MPRPVRAHASPSFRAASPQPLLDSVEIWTAGVIKPSGCNCRTLDVCALFEEGAKAPDETGADPAPPTLTHVGASDPPSSLLMTRAPLGGFVVPGRQ